MGSIGGEVSCQGCLGMIGDVWVKGEPGEPITSLHSRSRCSLCNSLSVRNEVGHAQIGVVPAFPSALPKLPSLISYHLPYLKTAHL